MYGRTRAVRACSRTSPTHSGSEALAPASELTIVMPVFNALTQTLASVQRVLTHTTGAYRLVENSQNRGFAGAVNAGLARAESGDVVILKGDCAVTAGCKARLARSSGALRNVATATPVTNAAGFFSVRRERRAAACRRRHRRHGSARGSAVPARAAARAVGVAASAWTSPARLSTSCLASMTSAALGRRRGRGRGGPPLGRDLSRGSRACRHLRSAGRSPRPRLDRPSRREG